ncbi:hypothetical protein AMJ49_02010 [Parcubacteria bacterium DG_74_2]|nr:MAG: hypothetical protein AMJ49_02010 [Parcubacteria bacterium DG_74_2]
MIISTRSQYGLRAMVFLAKNRGKILPLKEISKKEDISLDYLEKIISKLKKVGLVKAKKGIGGGYFLTKKPSKIKIGQIIRPLDGEFSLVKCIAKNKKAICSKERKCLTKKFWKKMKKSLDSALDSITLSDLLKK